MSTQSREDERGARNFEKSLRLMQLCVLAFHFTLSRQGLFLLEQRHELWIYSERRGIGLGDLLWVWLFCPLNLR